MEKHFTLYIIKRFITCERKFFLDVRIVLTLVTGRKFLFFFFFPSSFSLSSDVDAASSAAAIDAAAAAAFAFTLLILFLFFTISSFLSAGARSTFMAISSFKFSIRSISSSVAGKLIPSHLMYL